MQLTETTRNNIIHCMMTPFGLLRGMSEDYFEDIVIYCNNDFDKIFEISDIELFKSIVNINMLQFKKLMMIYYKNDTLYQIAKYIVTNFVDRYIYGYNFANRIDDVFELHIKGKINDSYLDIMCKLDEDKSATFSVRIDNKYIRVCYNTDNSIISTTYIITMFGHKPIENDNICVKIDHTYDIKEDKYLEPLFTNSKDIDGRNILAADLDNLEDMIMDVSIVFDNNYPIIDELYKKMLSYIRNTIDGLIKENKAPIFYCALKNHEESGLVAQYPKGLYDSIKQVLKNDKYSLVSSFDYKSHLCENNGTLYYIETYPNVDTNNIYEVNITIIYDSGFKEFNDKYLIPLGLLKDTINIFTFRRMIEEYATCKQSKVIKTRAFYEEYELEKFRWDNKYFNLDSNKARKEITVESILNSNKEVK